MLHRVVSLDLKACIPVLHQCGYDIGYRRYVISLESRKLWFTILSHIHSCTYGVPFNIHTRQTGCPQLLKSADICFIQVVIDRRQIVYINELQEELYQAQNTRVSIPTLLRTLQRLDFSHKLVLRKAAECNDLLWSAFMNHIVDVVPNPDMLMFVDEAARDRWTSQWKFGWLRRGTRCTQQQS
jgi:hypothetical protein